MNAAEVLSIASKWNTTEQHAAFDAAQARLTAVKVRNEAKIVAAILEAIATQRTVNPFQRLTVEDVYDTIGKAHKLTVEQTQAVLLRMAASRSIELGLWSAAVATHPAPQLLIPASREFKFYIR